MKLFDMDGVKLTFEEDALREIAALALERNTGARGLRSILEQVMTDMMFEIPSRSDIGEVRITAKFIRGEEKAIYLPKAVEENLSLLEDKNSDSAIVS